MKVENLNNVRKVTFVDYSDYESDKCNNGGQYAYFTNYTRVENGFEVSYSTTADFEYCPVCGSFEDHYEGECSENESQYSCGEYEVISADELLQKINNFSETEDEYIIVM